MSYETLSRDERKELVPCVECKKKPSRIWINCGSYIVECDNNCHLSHVLSASNKARSFKKWNENNKKV